MTRKNRNNGVRLRAELRRSRNSHGGTGSVSVQRRSMAWVIWRLKILLQRWKLLPSSGPGFHTTSQSERYAAGVHCVLFPWLLFPLLVCSLSKNIQRGDSSWTWTVKRQEHAKYKWPQWVLRGPASYQKSMMILMLFCFIFYIITFLSGLGAFWMEPRACRLYSSLS